MSSLTPVMSLRVIFAVQFSKVNATTVELTGLFIPGLIASPCHASVQDFLNGSFFSSPWNLVYNNIIGVTAHRFPGSRLAGGLEVEG